jgi:hypothetical protein
MPRRFLLILVELEYLGNIMELALLPLETTQLNEEERYECGLG